MNIKEFLNYERGTKIMSLPLILQALAVLLICFVITGVAVWLSCGLKKKEERDEE